VKFCIDCRYSEEFKPQIPDAKKYTYYCTRPDMVTGAPGKVAWTECRVERGMVELCGPDARFFEPIPEKAEYKEAIPEKTEYKSVVTVVGKSGGKGK